MRQILFRGRRKLNGVWVYGSLIKETSEDWDFIVPEGTEYGDFEKEQTRIITNTIGQFTGLMDKNLKQIYEGDIVKVERLNDSDIICLCQFGTVQRQMDTGWLVAITGFYFARKDGLNAFPIVKNAAGKNDLEVMTVIGNIHENPQLLK